MTQNAVIDRPRHAGSVTGRLPQIVTGRARYTVEARESLNLRVRYDSDAQLAFLTLRGDATSIEVALNLAALLEMLDETAAHMAADRTAIGQATVAENPRLQGVLERLQRGDYRQLRGTA